MMPGWSDALPPGEGKDRLLKSLREAAEKLVEIMPKVEALVEAYVDKGAEKAEKHANEGDE